MTKLNTVALPAVARYEGLERLDLLEWEGIHDAVQVILSGMDGRVIDAVPGSTARAGRNSTNRRPLFTYRVFSPPIDSVIDPVVVGISFASDQRGTRIRGDIAGETVGDILFEPPARDAFGKLPILTIAQDLAEQLAAQWNTVTQALRDSSRQV